MLNTDNPLASIASYELFIYGLPELADTHPHQKHIPPDIKHHRVPAPGLSFDSPNLPLLIEEIEQTHTISLPARVGTWRPSPPPRTCGGAGSGTPA